MNDYGVVTAPDTVRIERLMPGPIERLWSYLTESEKRRTWMAEGAIELHPGGKVEHVFRNGSITGYDEPVPEQFKQYEPEAHMRGRVIDCDPPRMLSYTWGENGSEVKFELSPQGEQVLLVVTHSRLPNRDEIVSVCGGWHSHLDVLQELLAGRTPHHFWSNLTRVEAEYQRRIPQR